ncbi:MAG: protein kinase [Phycisphaerales bacterium]|jgi:serine/threonine protein kinase|nr:protein kinase [Phycisphaerales bacterium]
MNPPDSNPDPSTPPDPHSSGLGDSGAAGRGASGPNSGGPDAIGPPPSSAPSPDAPSSNPPSDPSDDALVMDALNQARARGKKPAPIPIAPPPDIFPGYQILREISRGGQGVVYQALSKSTKRKVAIKVLREGPFVGVRDRIRFEREIDVLSQLNHPNIVAVQDSGVAGGLHYFVMDYISGHTLDNYIRDADRTIEDTLALFHKICDAVNAAHLRGIVHRDLKPANIRVDASGEPHILDFGLAKGAGTDIIEGEQLQVMTATGDFLGSLPWSSPEQAERAPDKIDVRTDVYSLGVILYQLLTGRFPYDVLGNFREALDRILHEVPKRPSTIKRGINDEVETIVLKCLSKERERRYQNAGELARDIRNYLAGDPIEAKRDSQVYAIRKVLQRHKAATLAALVSLAAIIAGGVVSAAFWRGAEHQKTIAQQALAETVKVQAVADSATSFAGELITSLDPEIARGLDTTLLRELLRDVDQKAAERFAQQPLARAAIDEFRGTTYAKLGDLTQAADLLRRALSTRTDALGESHPETRRARLNLAAALCERRLPTDLDEAAALADSIISAASAANPSPEESDLSIEATRVRAYARKLQARHDEALKLYTQVLDARTRDAARGADPTLVAAAHADLAELAHDRRDLAGAIDHIEKAINIHLSNPGKRPLALIGGYQSLASYLSQSESTRGQNDARITQLFESALSQCDALRLDAAHPYRAASVNKYATHLWRLARAEKDATRRTHGLARAAELHATNLAARSRALAPTHDNVNASRLNLANCRIDLREFDAAQSLLNDVMRDKPPADRYHQIARAKRITLAAARAKADPANAAPIFDSAAKELDELCRSTLLPDGKEHAASAAAELARAIVATASSANADQLAGARARARAAAILTQSFDTLASSGAPAQSLAPLAAAAPDVYTDDAHAAERNSLVQRVTPASK